MKVLLIGANGQLGRNLHYDLKLNHWNVIPITRQQWDMASNPSYGIEITNFYKPDFIINLAAYTNVDAAENESYIANKVNCLSAKYLAIGAQSIGAPLIHLSTDYVFHGDSKDRYKEYDDTNPVNEYGRTKLCGEKEVTKNCEKFLIIRTSWLFSLDGNNFFNTIVNLSKTKNQIRVINDQWGCPTSISSLSKAINELIKSTIVDKNHYWGIYHFSGDKVVSWYQFAEQILREISLKDPAYIIPELKPCLSKDYGSIAERPKYSALNNNLIKEKFNIPSCDWRSDLKKTVKKLIFSR